MGALETTIQSNLTLILSLLLATLVIMLAVIAWLFVKIRKISKKSELFFSGKKGENLEEIINTQSKDLRNLDKEIQQLFEGTNKLHKLALRGLHKVGVVRFNPFKDLGGNQSFAISLLDGKNSGIVISSLHTREGTRVYAKPILSGESEKYPLTEEEQRAIKISTTNKLNKQ